MPRGAKLANVEYHVWTPNIAKFGLNDGMMVITILIYEVKNVIFPNHSHINCISLSKKAKSNRVDSFICDK